MVYTTEYWNQDDEDEDEVSLTYPDESFDEESGENDA